MGIWSGVLPERQVKFSAPEAAEPCFAPPQVSIEPLVTAEQRSRYRRLVAREEVERRRPEREVAMTMDQPAQLIDGDPAMYGPPD